MIVGRNDLSESRRYKKIEDVQAADLSYSRAQAEAEIIWFEDAGKRKRIKDRDNALDHLILNSAAAGQ